MNTDAKLQAVLDMLLSSVTKDNYCAAWQEVAEVAKQNGCSLDCFEIERNQLTVRLSKGLALVYSNTREVESCAFAAE